MSQDFTVKVLHCDEHTLSVEAIGGNACSRCASGKGCGLGFISRETSRTLVLQHDRSDRAFDGIAVGESLDLELPVPILMRFILLTLAVPAVMIVVTVLLASYLGTMLGASSSLSAIIGLVLALPGGAVLARIAGTKLTESCRYGDAVSVIAYTRDGSKFHAKIDAQHV